MPTFVIELDPFMCPMGKEMEAEGTQQHIQAHIALAEIYGSYERVTEHLQPIRIVLVFIHVPLL